MSMIRDAQQVLRGWRNQHISESVTYRRGTDTYTIRASQAATTVTLDSGDGVITKTKVADWLIDISSFPVVALGEPQRGDQIDFDGFRYSIADNGNEHCWRWHGTQKRTYRVHTKNVPITETA
jgi:hypothetical protein